MGLRIVAVASLFGSKDEVGLHNGILSSLEYSTGNAALFQALFCGLHGFFLRNGLLIASHLDERQVQTIGRDHLTIFCGDNHLHSLALGA